jgi:hypothetical protein
VDVRRQRRGIGKRPDTDERDLAQPAIVTPHRDFALRAAVYLMRPAAVGGNDDPPRCALQKRDLIRLDQGVEHEGAAGLALAVAAMAAVHEHRRRREPIAHRPARAPAFQRFGHLIVPPQHAAKRTAFFAIAERAAGRHALR